MTAEKLQDDLVEEFKQLFSEDLFKKPDGSYTSINVYPQSLPIAESDEDEAPIPYIIVRLNDGEDANTADSNNKVKLVVIIGIWDGELNAQGHRTLLHVINTIYQRFFKDPCLNNQFVYDGPFKWTIQEDGYYPYFFGAIEMSFNIPAIRREDKFS